MVIAEPEILTVVAAEMQALNASVWAGNAAAAAPTTGVVPAASDLVSMLTAAQFATHARIYQEISARAATIREQLAKHRSQDSCILGPSWRRRGCLH